jgi:hypothetical protein
MAKRPLPDTLRALTTQAKAIVRTLDERLAEVERVASESPGDASADAEPPAAPTKEALEQLRASQRAIAADLDAIEYERVEEEREAEKWAARVLLAREGGREDLARQAEVRERERRALAALHAAEAERTRAMLREIDRVLAPMSPPETAR